MQTGHFPKGGAKGLYAPTGFDRAYRFSVLGSRALSRISTEVRLPPTVELPTDRSAIVAANHSSLFDLVASLIVLGHYGVTARLAVNSRFFENPAAGAFLRSIGCIPFSRDNREEAEQTMIDALVAGEACAMMPEGKIIRRPDQVAGVGEGRPGISRMARLANAAVVPVAFAESEHAWVPGRPLPRVANRRKPIIVKLGEPIVFETDDHIANANAVMSAISALVLDGRTHASGDELAA